MQAKPLAIVIGVSSGICAVFAERVAKRGDDLVVVARLTQFGATPF